MAKFYTGIGSRDIGPEAETIILAVSAFMHRLSWTCVSGNASGSDIAFQMGNPDHLAILPWPQFNHERFKPNHERTLDHADIDAFKSVAKYHPRASSLTPPVKKLMARNYRQVVGEQTLSSLVICYADYLDGKPTKVVGGTGQAVRIALDLGIPVVNLKACQTLADFQRFCITVGHLLSK